MSGALLEIKRLSSMINHGGIITILPFEHFTIRAEWDLGGDVGICRFQASFSDEFISDGDLAIDYFAKKANEHIELAIKKVESQK